MSAKARVRCAVYTRKSTEEGLEQDFNSLDAQREAGEAYVLSQKAEGWIVLPNAYDDGGYSGGTLERPALQRLIADIEAGKVDVVAVYKIDRLSRSLMDFAKLVEVFDRKNVTFVSVTQSFNTTTSMGRLTLNVLLSFAQFEREVTGERIRDKFAASKKKGMWMGGTPPFGYDIVSRKLLVNEAEASTVRLIFQRYLDLGSVRHLRDDLAGRGVVSKIWTSTTGIAHGGKPFDRGALYCLLKNRIYLGETLHKGAAYPGEHDAILPETLFQSVQDKLAVSRQRVLGKPGVRQEAPLAGLLFDEEGFAMKPTYGIKNGSVKYRYYIAPKRDGTRSASTLSSVRAPALEELLIQALIRLGRHAPSPPPYASSDFRPLLRRITIRAHSILLELDRTTALQAWQAVAGISNVRTLIAHARSRLGPGEELSEGEKGFTLMLPVRARFRGGRTSAVTAHGAPLPSSRPDSHLLAALARAHNWKTLLMEGRIASIEALAIHAGQERRHVGRTLNLAFLAPDLALAILDGKQPAGLRLSDLLESDIPCSWCAQRQWLGDLVRAKPFKKAELAAPKIWPQKSTAA